MQCLLDKVTARYIVRGQLKLNLALTLTADEISALNLFTVSRRTDLAFYISSPTANVLHQFARTLRFTSLIQLFLSQITVIHPVRYYKRWARRLRAYGFTREDAAILALATFGASATNAGLGMDYVATFDQAMINHWATQRIAIQARLTRMCADLSPPYNTATIPQVLRPEQISIL